MEQRGEVIFTTKSSRQRAQEYVSERNHEEIKKRLQGRQITVQAFGRTWYTTIEVDKYRQNGRTAIELFTNDGENFCTLTTNLDHAQLVNREILVKTWSENEEIAKSAISSGLFADTGKRVSTGFVEAEIWEVL